MTFVRFAMASANEQAFLCAALPERFRILGIDLLPFTVGHHVLLSRLRNRFVVTDEKQEIFDLFQALFVCSRSFDEGLRTVRSRQFNRWLRRRRASLWLRCHLLPVRLQSLSPVSTAHLIGQFADYLLAHSTVPALSPSDDEEAKRDPGTPFLQFICVTLMSRLNHSPHEAMDKPWGHAIHDVFAYWELEGRTKITSEDERELHEEHVRLLKEMDAKLAAIEKELNGPL